MSFNAPAPALVEPDEVIEPEPVRARPLPRAHLPTQALAYVDQRSWNLHVHVHDGAEPHVPYVHQPATVPSRQTRTATTAAFVVAALVSLLLTLAVWPSVWTLGPLLAVALNTAVAVRVATYRHPLS